jgi:2-polyprenyl-3-methyl-5-hydroxy-6-metoxy-1,4-benzoquinol methylase
MSGPARGYWFECDGCGFLASSLEPAIGNDAAHETIDEPRRREALAILRSRNFERVLDRLALLTGGEPRTVLDVGCAHGWFLEAAARRGHTATGLEPDPSIADQARSRGLSVISGFFPEGLPGGAHFDVITFNDVLEHLPDPRAAVDACRERLTPGGLLAVTLPSSRGVLFRAARALGALGAHGPMDRLWQRGFPSPHVTYFHPAGLAALMGTRGFREIHRGSLPSFTRKGLWSRLRYDRRSCPAVSAALYVPLLLLAPLLGIFPPDISFQVFQSAGPGRPR